MRYTVLVITCLTIIAGLTINSCKKKPCKEKHQTLHPFSVNDSVYVDSTSLWLPQSYTLDITTCKKDQYELTIYNLSDNGETITGTLGGTTITIDEQVVDGNTYSGNGKWINSNLTINYDYISSTGDTLIGAGTGTE